MEILLVLQIVVVIALIGIILVQKSSTDGFTGGSSPNSFLTGRASANLFTKTTAVLATIFIANSLVLAYIASHTERADSILEKAAEEVNKAKSENSGKAEQKSNLQDLQKKIEENIKPKSATEKTGSSSKTDNPSQQTPSVPTSE